MVCSRTIRSCFPPAKLLGGYSTRLHLDLRPGLCTRRLERWLFCTIRRHLWSRNQVQDSEASGRHQRGPAPPNLDGRTPDRIGSGGVSHQYAGPPIVLGHQTDPKLQSDGVVPSTPVLSAGMHDAGRSSHRFQGSIDPGAGASSAFWSPGTTRQE